MIRWCEDCGQPARATRCDECRHDYELQLELDQLDQDIEVLDDCG